MAALRAAVSLPYADRSPSDPYGKRRYDANRQRYSELRLAYDMLLRSTACFVRDKVRLASYASCTDRPRAPPPFTPRTLACLE